MDLNCKRQGGALSPAQRWANAHLWSRRRLLSLAAVSLACLTACGGGGGSTSETAEAGCTVREQQDWLAGYMNEWYFWYRLAPQPDPAAFGDTAGYFKARLYTGSDAAFPADRWSGRESSASFARFFTDGESLGYGVSVAGLEVAGQPSRPLYVRGVDPGSPAALAGVVRGDQVLRINGRSTFDVISADDFGALSTTQTGQTLNLSLQRGSQVVDLRLTSAVYTITPVTGSQVFTTSFGRRVGYLAVKNMISQALNPIDAAFDLFRTQQVQDLVLDLRYNGGGLVSVGGQLASYVAGLAASGNIYASLLYNDRRAAQNNAQFKFSTPANGLSLTRVFVLTGPRTCSASEQVINGLRGVGVQVVSVGDTTCGKPVGFLPTDRCGQTYSVVNFESVNARNEGRYWDGFDATCAVDENFQVPQGSAADPLLAAATQLAGGGSCPARPFAAGDGGRKTLLAARRPAGFANRLDERIDMLGR